MGALERQLREQRASSDSASVWGVPEATSLSVSADPAVDLDGAKRGQRNQVLRTQEVADESRERLRHAIEVSAVSEQGAMELVFLFCPD